MIVVGPKEEKNKSVAVRQRSEGDQGEMKLEKFMSKIQEEIAKKK
jgi:threonyl-tRNA synthetase